MEGLLFVERFDDAAFEQEHEQLLLEESWKHPDEFGHIESRFENHLTMLAKRSEALGITTIYSKELLNLNQEIAALQGTMMSYDAFYQMACLCPEELGMSLPNVGALFGQSTSEHEAHPGHDAHNEGNGHSHESEYEIDPITGKKTKKKKKKRGWFGVEY